LARCTWLFCILGNRRPTVTESVAETRKETLKELIRDLHEGADPERVKEKLRQALGNATAVEIAQAEEELILEGMPSEEIHRLCDIHLAVFRESLESAKPLAAPGHPVYILMEEHKVLLRFGAELMAVAQGLRGGANSVGPNRLVELESLVENLKDSESHYVREENVLFPYLERHGITQPPAIMWMEHDQIREVKKGLYGLVGNHGSMGFSAFAGQLETVSSALAELLTSHFQKESSILFPAALRVITEEEWTEARQQFDELGYCRFTPEEATGLVEEVAEATAPAREVEARVSFESGALSVAELEAILNALPVDITFVDKDDRVKYFNQSKERIFPRTRAIIGRRVEQCHPQKSVHIVSRIVEEFRSGRRDVAEFWIDYEGMFVHILYFAVRDRDGQYLGVLEVTQDIMHMKQLEGEKRLLDEADDA
jgi:PAS domain S-box-containing protein